MSDPFVTLDFTGKQLATIPADQTETGKSRFTP